MPCITIILRGRNHRSECFNSALTGALDSTAQALDEAEDEASVGSHGNGTLALCKTDLLASEAPRACGDFIASTKYHVCTHHIPQHDRFKQVLASMATYIYVAALSVCSALDVSYPLLTSSYYTPPTVLIDKQSNQHAFHPHSRHGWRAYA